MVVKVKEIEFDPGFAPYIMAFQGTLEYMYSDINRFKNLSQKKIKFMQYYKKILEVFYNNAGFYTGCLMWASYIKAQPKTKIASNSFLGLEYNEAENVSDIDYVINFAELFPKDMKYFLGQNFAFDQKVLDLLNVYREFLIINKGFTASEYNTDILLPESVIQDNIQEYKALIDNAIEEGNLNKLKDSINIVLK